MKKILLSTLLFFIATGFIHAQNPKGSPKPGELANDQRSWQGIPGLERTANGRVFVSWFSGGEKEPSPENEVYLCYSDDNGITFTSPRVMAVPREGSRCFDPTLWIDPEGRLWYIYNRGNKETAEHGVYARICKRPDAKKPVFGREFRIGFDEAPYAFRMNKPVVLSSGEWIMPVTHATEPVFDWFAGAKQLQGVAISTDKGRTWKLHGAVEAPPWALECMITEMRDGRLWMLIRTGSGFLWESYSHDKGRSWTKGKESTIPNPGSRFFIRRLQSENLLLVNHYKYDGRSHLTAQISGDEGKTWNEGLLLDERTNISYPDGVQDNNGSIWMVYDRDRQGKGEILMAKFREEDVTAGKNISKEVRLKQIVSQLDKQKLLPDGWNPGQAADQVMDRLINVSAPGVKGAHDASFVIFNGHAYIASMANDVEPGENPAWPYVYLTLSVVDLKKNSVEQIIPMAKGGQAFKNNALPPGACFVPRIIKLNDQTLRCFFASENPGKRQSQVWYIDFDVNKQVFCDRIYKAKLQTSDGTFHMQPRFFYKDAVKYGFKDEPVDYGLYPFDIKSFDGKMYAAVNNFPGGQNALAILNDQSDTFRLLGHYNRPFDKKLTESAVNRLPDGTWMAICRQELGSRNYMFTTSKDGRNWTPAEYRDFVSNGDRSKPTFDKFNGIYYLGWQELTKVDGVHRSVFNIDVSRDGKNWVRKYRFATTHSFQYPSFHQYKGAIYLTVTQGDHSDSRKERIMFGKLENLK